MPASARKRSVRRGAASKPVGANLAESVAAQVDRDAPEWRD